MTLENFTEGLLQSIEDSQLVLHENMLPSEEFNNLFSTYLGTEQLIITGTEVLPSETLLTIRGKSSFLELNDAEVEITFELLNQDILLKLVVSLTDSWHFSQSFPALASTTLDWLELSNSTLILSTISQESVPENGMISEGWQLTSQITPNFIFSPLDKLWDQTVRLNLHGFISQDEDQFSVDLRLDIPDDFVFGNLAVQDLQMHMIGPIESEWGTGKKFVTSVNGRLRLGAHELECSTTLPNGSPVISLTMLPKNLELPSLSSLTELLPDVDLELTLPDGLPDLNQFNISQIDLFLDLSSRELTLISVFVDLQETWNVIPDQFSFANPSILWHIRRPFTAEARTIEVVLGGEALFSNVATDAFVLMPGLMLHGEIPQIEFVELTKIANVEGSLPEQFSDFALEDIRFEIDIKSKTFSFTGQSTSLLELPIGIDGLQIKDLLFEILIDPSQDRAQTVAGNLSGTLTIGSSSFEVRHGFPGDFVLTGEMTAISLSLLLQEFCDGDVIRDLPLPANILETELKNVTFTIAPEQKQLSFAAETPLGQAEIIISQGTNGSWGFSIGFVPPGSWNFAAIDPALFVLNDLDFSGSTLIVSSSDDSSLALTTISLPQGGVRVQKGLNFFASLDTDALGVKEMLPGFELDRLQVYAAIGNNPQNMMIEAAIEGQFQIDKSTSFGDISFRLKPSPSDFEVALLGTVTTIIDDSPLIFTGGLVVTAPPPAGGLEATMIGTWDNPFGVQNLSVSNVGLDLKIPPSLVPSIGIVGGLRVGDFEGKAAVSLNTANPTKSMLAVEFNELQLVDIFDAFCPPQVRQAIPRDLAATILDVAFEDVKIHIVPQATTIGEVQFEQGITLQGRMLFWGLTADGFLSIDQGTGIVVKGDVDNIVLGSMFKLTGAQGKAKASLLADLRVGQATSVDISGAMEILGMSREAALAISDTGFFFTTSGKIFNLFEATLAVRGSDMVNGDGIMVKATMKNDLFDYLSDKTSAAIEAAAKEATREIEAAQRDVNHAQTDVNQLNKSITAMRRTIEDERERDSKRLRDAQNAVQGEQNKVNSLNQQIANMRNTIQRERDRDAANLSNARQTVQGAQNKVNSLNSNITSMRRTVQAERDRDTTNLRRAQTSVNDAQKEVNKIQQDINSTKSRIATINKQIAAKKRWLDKRAWHEKIWAGPEYAAYESAKRVEQGALYTKIGGMEAAKHTALGVLEAAKRSLRGMEQAAKTFPIDADPRVAALITARATATAAMNAAKATLRGLEKAVKTFPIDADPRILGLITALNTAKGALASAKLVLKGIEAIIKVFPVDADPRIMGLFTARDTATASLEVAKFTLEGAKQSVKGMTEVIQFIDESVGQLLVINEATFESSLSAAHGGDVSLAVKLTFMSEPHDLALSFDFHDPMESVRALTDLLLPG